MKKKINNPKSFLEKVALGTVQFGMKYGVANESDLISKFDLQRLLQNAHQYGVTTLDTAPSYGSAEKRIGEAKQSDWSFITKVSVSQSQLGQDDFCRQQIQNSLQNLKVDILDSVLVHDPDNLKSAVGIDFWQELLSLKADGLVKKVGYTVYSPEQLNGLFDEFHPDIVQFPMSVADRRFISSGWVEKLQKLGIETHARSLFLQGVLLMDTGHIPKFFNRESRFFDRWDAFCSDNCISKLEGCVRFAKNQSLCNTFVFGVQDLNQFDELVEACVNSERTQVPDSLHVQDVTLLDPSLWPDTQSGQTTD